MTYDRPVGSLSMHSATGRSLHQLDALQDRYFLQGTLKVENPAESAVLSAGLKIAAPIVRSAIAQSIQSLKSASRQITDRVVRELGIGYSDFLVASYNRCQQVKTLVSGDRPLPLAEVYVNLKLTYSDNTVSD